MGKTLLWIGAVMFAIYLVKTQYLNSSTWIPFRDGCLAAGSATEAQCNCLTDYVHERFSDKEVQQIMDQRIDDPVFAEKVKQTVMAGTLACRNPQ